MQGVRNYYLDRGRMAAAMTLPYLIPDSNDPETDPGNIKDLPYTGVGATGVHNLASRMLLALLPPTETFFRFLLNERKVIELGINRDQRHEIETALSRMEQEVLRSIETTNDRVAVHEALLWLLVAGNILMYVGEDGLRNYHMNRYVLRRDDMGRPANAITCELVDRNDLPESIKAQLREIEGLQEEVNAQPEPLSDGQPDKQVRVYTDVIWNHDKGVVTWQQEIKGQKVGEQGSGKIESSPWLPLRMYRADGEDYAPGYVESRCLADLRQVDALQQALTEGALGMARLVWLVSPNGVTKAADLARARNGEFVVGQEQDVKALQTQKAQDFSVAYQVQQRLEARLAQAFLLADVRDSERTTAEEVRLQAAQLEQALGSIYAVLVQEFQQPYVARKLQLLIRANKLAELPREMVTPVPSVGLAAVGRLNDLERMVRFSQVVQQTLGEGAIATYINPSELMRRVAVSMGLNVVDLVKDEEQVQAEQQQALQAQQAMAMMQSPAADPQRQAQAAQIEQEMAAAEQPTP